MAKNCPIRGCLEDAANDHVFCEAHWLQTPKPLRDAIWDAHRRNDHGASLRNILEAMRLLMRPAPTNKEPS